MNSFSAIGTVKSEFVRRVTSGDGAGGDAGVSSAFWWVKASTTASKSPLATSSFAAVRISSNSIPSSDDSLLEDIFEGRTSAQGTDNSSGVPLQASLSTA